ncbi:hypothetical protein TNCV_4204491 [Trichonephila clavipes]|nr:hypothetical protein TNCV_4204491 [Trichonephila clavipes]
MAPSYPNFLTIPKKGCLSLDRFNVQRLSLHGSSSVAQGSNSRHASNESTTLITATQIYQRKMTSVANRLKPVLREASLETGITDGHSRTQGGVLGVRTPP